MSNQIPFSGRVGWIDLTIPQTEAVRDFYSRVLDLEPEPVDMGGYSDFNMVSPDTGQPVVGICHPQGPNAGLPPQWLVYFTVPDLEAALALAVENGGVLVGGPRSGFCVLRDPAGAVFALFEMPENSQSSE